MHSSTACSAQDKAGPQLGLYDGQRRAYGRKSLGVPPNSYTTNWKKNPQTTDVFIETKLTGH